MVLLLEILKQFKGHCLWVDNEPRCENTDNQEMARSSRGAGLQRGEHPRQEAQI